MTVGGMTRFCDECRASFMGSLWETTDSIKEADVKSAFCICLPITGG